MNLVPVVYQWAETESIASGLLICFAISDQFFEYTFSSIAFIGDPWPTNKAGILSLIIVTSYTRLSIYTAAGMVLNYIF